MRNKLLVCFDQLIGKTDRVARFCKSISGKWLGIISMVTLCCTVVSFMGTDALKNIPIIKSAYYDTIVANWPQFVDFLSADIGKVVFSIALLAVCICYMFRGLYRPFATLIAHSTMGHDLSVLHEPLKSLFGLFGGALIFSFHLKMLLKIKLLLQYVHRMNHANKFRREIGVRLFSITEWHIHRWFSDWVTNGARLGKSVFSIVFGQQRINRNFKSYLHM